MIFLDKVQCSVKRELPLSYICFLRKIERNGCYYQSSESLINALVNGGDEDIPLDEQQGNVIDMSGQVIRIRGGDFVGPTIINGRLVGTRRGTHARGRSQISINGQPLDQYIASSCEFLFSVHFYYYK